MGYSYTDSPNRALQKAIQRLAPHDHLCQTYESVLESQELAGLFLQVGLSKEERCVNFLPAERIPSVADWLRHYGTDAESLLAQGRLLFLEMERFFSPEHQLYDRLLDELTSLCADAFQRGFPSLRVVLDMSWVSAPGADERSLIRFEARLNQFLADRACTVLCQYPQDPLTPFTQQGLLETHPLVLCRDRICPNFYFVSPEAVLQPERHSTDVDSRLSHIRKYAEVEEHLRKSEERLELTLNGSHQGMWDWDLRDDTLHMRCKWTEMLGYPSGEIEPSHQAWERLIHPHDRERVSRAIEDHIQRKTDEYEAEYRLLSKDGRWKWILDRGRVVEWDEAGRPLRAIGTHTDISRMKVTEEALRNSETELATVFDYSPVMMFIVDQDRVIQKMNRTAALQTGLEEHQSRGAAPRPLLRCLLNLRYSRDCLEGRDCRDCLLRQAVIDTLTNQKSYSQMEFSLPISRDVPPQEQTYLLSTVYLPIQNLPRVLLCLEDITDRKNLQNQLLQAQKMEALGRLAGGVAHDFNNLLLVIDGYLELSLSAELDSAVRLYLSEIQKASKRAATITRQLLAFSRKPATQAENLNLNAVVSDMKNLFLRVLGEDIRLETRLASNLWLTCANLNQLEQVILNLIVNAREAMPTGGRILLETCNVYLNDRFRNLFFPIRPGEYVGFTVQDSGTGIDENTIKHIFEPFFTTKGKNKGTGLGLSMVYGFIQQNQGNLGVFSMPGMGTTFRFFLPRSEGEQKAQESVPEEKGFDEGNETILLVEDDDSVRSLTQQILVRQGYRVVEARNGREAWEFVEQSDEKIDLLLTDVVMPEMGGPELAKKLMETRPETKILFMSGYANEAILPHGLTGGEKNLIQKPFRSKALTRKIREILGD